MHAHPDTQLAINTGVAGGVPGKVEIGEVVVADRVAYADVDITAGGKYVYGELPGYPRFLPSGSELFRKVSLPHKIGTILTGDKFFSEPEDIEPLLEGPYRNENVLAFDMESAAFAQSALFYGVPFVSVRAISDIIGIKGQLQDFEDNLERAALNSNRMLLEALIHLEK
jgi:adenosylhomocysteine nucleosidase